MWTPSNTKHSALASGMEQQEAAVNLLKTRRGGWFEIAILGRPDVLRKTRSDPPLGWGSGEMEMRYIYIYIHLRPETRCDTTSTTKLQTVCDLFAIQPKDLYNNLSIFTYWFQTKFSVDWVRVLPCIRELPKCPPVTNLAIWSPQILLYIRIRANGWNVHNDSHIRPEFASRWTTYT